MKTQFPVRWSESHRIGDDRIDQDHQYIFNLLQQAGSANTADDNAVLVYQLLSNLLTFSQMHFTDEELLMRRIHLPEYVQHTCSHQRLLQRMEGLQEKLTFGFYVTLEDIVVLLEEWIEIDILTEDIKIGLAIAGR